MQNSPWSFAVAFGCRMLRFPEACVFCCCPFGSRFRCSAALQRGSLSPLPLGAACFASQKRACFAVALSDQGLDVAPRFSAAAFRRCLWVPHASLPRSVRVLLLPFRIKV